ncbi:MAG: spondin domain-containing protein [Xanthomonadales bacterium]|jgi:hypothetical protein|nr:spondin domain-containing protein [Xanthomonadales bacterium]
MNLRSAIRRALLPAAFLVASPAFANEVRVTVENLSPAGGLYLTPLWVGFHDGTFDLYDRGAPASVGVERFAEDGDFGALREAFGASGGLDAVILNPEGFAGAPVFDPGQSTTQVFELDPSVHRFFSYGAMLLPSNDAFIANGDPQAVNLFDESGEFTGPVSFVVYGNEVLDAGTEANTETDAAFFDQSAPDTGVVTNDTVELHPGFNGSVGNPDGTPVNFLGGALPTGTTLDPALGDFTRGLAPLMRVTIRENRLPVRVSVRNTAPPEGIYLTPVWLGYHDGSFDLFNEGDLASLGLERMAEDGDFGALRMDFETNGSGQDQVVLNPAGFPGAPLFDPGFSSTEVVILDPAEDRYLSFTAMILPSNDAFIGNEDATAYPLFDESGTFTGPLTVRVFGDQVWDAGTEANTEADAAFFDQSMPDAGEATTDGVALHPGFNGSLANPDATPVNFLGGTNGAGIFFDEEAADFTLPGRQVAEIRVSRVVDGGHSGTWYDADQDGQGLVIEITGSDGADGLRAVVSWYTYRADGSGDPLWLIGEGPVLGDTAIVDLVQANGAIFGEDFMASDVLRSIWGEVRITFESCTEATLVFDAADAAFGSGTQALSRLTGGPADFAGACQP